KSCLLVGDRQIAPAKAQNRERAKGPLNVMRLHRQRKISPVGAGLVEPEAMQQRRARMAYRPSDDAGKACGTGDLHQTGNLDIIFDFTANKSATKEARRVRAKSRAA